MKTINKFWLSILVIVIAANISIWGCFYLTTINYGYIADFEIGLLLSWGIMGIPLLALFTMIVADMDWELGSNENREKIINKEIKIAMEKHLIKEHSKEVHRENSTIEEMEK